MSEGQARWADRDVTHVEVSMETSYNSSIRRRVNSSSGAGVKVARPSRFKRNALKETDSERRSSSPSSPSPSSLPSAVAAAALLRGN